MCVCDGAQSNRMFIKCHFDDLDPAEENFTTTNIYTGEPLTCTVDPSVSLLLHNYFNESGTI